MGERRDPIVSIYGGINPRFDFEIWPTKDKVAKHDSARHKNLVAVKYDLAQYDTL